VRSLRSISYVWDGPLGVRPREPLRLIPAPLVALVTIRGSTPSSSSSATLALLKWPASAVTIATDSPTPAAVRLSVACSTIGPSCLKSVASLVTPQAMVIWSSVVGFPRFDGHS
jgi:hypothetical protein